MIVNSIVLEDKRLFFQSDELVRSGVPVVLLIEGDLYGAQKRMDLRQLTGALSYLSVNSVVPLAPKRLSRG